MTPYSSQYDPIFHPSLNNTGMEAVSSELTFQPRANCFELFGFDFMLDPEWNVVLLEANAEPDLSKAGAQLQHVVDHIVEETVALTLDSNPVFQDAAAAADNGTRSPQVEPTSVVVFERAPRGW